jgi:hypothetical protein
MNVFTIDNKIDEFTEKLYIDELYERKRNADLQRLEIFNKMLNRIHQRIKLTSRKSNDKYCWFVVPEVILGVSNFDQPGCISYILDKLKDNGFNVFYYHPNSLFISWNHWIPSYVRNEWKKKTGIAVDGFGNSVETETPVLQITNNGMEIKDKKKKFTPIDTYKPKGIYSDLLNKNS